MADTAPALNAATQRRYEETLERRRSKSARREVLGAVRLSTVWAAGGALAVGLVFLTGGGAIIDAMTTSAEVRQAARAYLPWAFIAPIVGVACFQLDGIFIGAPAEKDPLVGPNDGTGTLTIPRRPIRRRLRKPRGFWRPRSIP